MILPSQTSFNFISTKDNKTMLKGVNPNDFYDFGQHHPSSVLKLTPPPQYASIYDAIYGSDEFRMYAYKIKRCTRARSHDWTECPYAHKGEKATRRDPRKVAYSAIACPSFRNGRCPKGDACEFAHGVFEYWLHPARYRTRACNAGRFCQRRVCFFAHTPEQLRSQKKYVCPVLYGARMNKGDHHHGMILFGFGSGGEEGATSSPVSRSSWVVKMDGGSYFEGVSDFLNSLRNLRIGDDDHGGGGDDHDNPLDRKKSGGGGLINEPEPDLPHIDWISELVK